MLLDNKVVEEKLQNGSIGEVHDICYKPGEKVGQKGAQLYVPCKFPKTCLTKNLMEDRDDATIIPIPICTKRCEKNCCWVTTLPLRVCKGLTAHKVQGMSIGDGEEFEKAIIHMPEGRMKNIPGLVLVMFTRLKETSDFAIGTKPHKLSMDDFVKLGNTPANND